MASPQPAWWKLDGAQLAEALETDMRHGLTEAAASARLREHGPNELAQEKGEGPLRRFLRQFNSTIVCVLIAAAFISGVLLHELVDTAAIVGIVLLNAILGFTQESRAERALAALRRLASPVCKVVRGGKLTAVPSDRLVPGDLVELEAGDRVPADGRVVFATSNFALQEASLTGESTAVVKGTSAIALDELALADRTNMVFMGTAVVAGRGRAVMAATGMRTELGRIAGMLQAIAPEPTPLQRKLDEFGRLIVKVALVLVAMVFSLQWWRGGNAGLADAFLTAVSLAVAAVPEGLPAVVTIALALGVQRMVKRNALIRRLPSVETLGCATVICSDKTGTLTRNEMTVQAVYAGGRLFEVTGAGYAPEGEFRLDGRPVAPATAPGLLDALACGALCNTAHLLQEEGRWTIAGDPTEGALLAAAAKAGITRESLDRQTAYADELPFDSERKMMTVLRRAGAGVSLAYVKGAPDLLLERCTDVVHHGGVRPLTAADRAAVLNVNALLADKALRVLGLARREFASPPPNVEPAAVEQNLTFLGLAAMIDPPREEARAAVAVCKTAGIRPVMITGDHKNTAVAVGRELGIFEADSAALAGADLDALSDSDLERRIELVPVYARVSPEHKLRIVRAWRRHGHIVAMTGDGVNDAPALKEADIGVAMGVTGTDVTKEVSDMIVTDDNFASIVAAVEEGRGIYDNIRKFVHYLLSCNAAEILVMFAAGLFGLPPPLLPAQILWINLVTDGLPALALGVDPPEKDIMRRRPRPVDEPVIGRRRMRLLLGQGLVIALCALAAFGYSYFLAGRWRLTDLFAAVAAFDLAALRDIFTVPHAMHAQVIAKARTVGFLTLAFCQDFQSYNCRSQHESLFKIGVFSNRSLLVATLVSMTLNGIAVYTPFFQTVLKTTPLGAGELLGVVLTASIPFWAMEFYKLLFRPKPLS